MEKNQLRRTLRISSAVYLGSVLSLSSSAPVTAVALVDVSTSELSVGGMMKEIYLHKRMTIDLLLLLAP